MRAVPDGSASELVVPEILADGLGVTGLINLRQQEDRSVTGARNRRLQDPRSAMSSLSFDGLRHADREQRAQPDLLLVHPA